MHYKTISPIPGRKGVGTFDTFFDSEKYSTVEIAVLKDDYVTIDFVKDEDGIIYLEFYHSKDPEEKIYHRLIIQYFLPSLGIDYEDDTIACEIANRLLEKYK